MLIEIAVVLLILWLLGVVTSYTISGSIHILLVAAIVLFLVRVIRGENPLK
ncbi:MAG TPA: lmo0937 family membrane protein [Negativicutes bacterium]|nr:lmo0937 family membrane protein [Negativicutes bacterium]